MKCANRSNKIVRATVSLKGLFGLRAFCPSTHHGVKQNQYTQTINTLHCLYKYQNTTGAMLVSQKNKKFFSRPGSTVFNRRMRHYIADADIIQHESVHTIVRTVVTVKIQNNR